MGRVCVCVCASVCYFSDDNCSTSSYVVFSTRENEFLRHLLLLLLLNVFSNYFTSRLQTKILRQSRAPFPIMYFVVSTTSRAAHERCSVYTDASHTSFRQTRSSKTPTDLTTITAGDLTAVRRVLRAMAFPGDSSRVTKTFSHFFLRIHAVSRGRWIFWKIFCSVCARRVIILPRRIRTR